MKNQKHNPQSKRAIWTRWIIVGLLVATTALDFISFAVHPEYWNFDMSPLVLLTNNIFIIALVKFGVVAGIIYMLFKVKGNDYFKFLWIMCSVYLILFQFVGFISNRQVAEQEPSPEAAPSEQVRLETGINFAIIWGYFPMIFSMISFWIFRWGWRDEF